MCRRGRVPRTQRVGKGVLTYMDTSYITIDRTSAVPMYKQLEQCIAQAIGTRILKPGDKLPTEDELAEAFGISRPVSRQAYSSLVASDKIVRERGRGSFVKARNYGSLASNILSFSQETILQGHVPTTRVLSFERRSLPEPVAEGRCPAGGDWFYLERTRYSDGIPAVYLETWVPAVFDKLADIDFNERSLYASFRELYGVIPTDAHRLVWAKNADARDAELLSIKEGAALAMLKSYVHDQDGRLIEVSIERYLGSNLRFDFEVHV